MKTLKNALKMSKNAIKMQNMYFKCKKKEYEMP